MAAVHSPRLQDELDRLFTEILSENATFGEPAPLPRPQSNLLETWVAYFLQVALPGADPGSLNIEVVARQVTVKGTYHMPAIETASSIWNGITAGTFEEAFQVPAEVDADRAEAQYERGILTIKLPKVAHLKASSIPIQTVP